MKDSKLTPKDKPQIIPFKFVGVGFPAFFHTVYYDLSYSIDLKTARIIKNKLTQVREAIIKLRHAESILELILKRTKNKRIKV